MTVANLYDGNTPTVNADANTWGDELNLALTQVKETLDDYATGINDAAALATAALPKSGGTMTGDIALADPTPASTSSAGFRGAPVNTQDATYTFARKDAGKMVRHTSASAHTWSIPTNASVGFGIGDVILLVNLGAGAINLARSSGVELRIVGTSTNADRSIPQYGTASMVKVDTNSWLLIGVAS